MQTPELNRELWPSTWSETRVKAIEVVSDVRSKVEERSLEVSELSKLNNVIGHLLFAWDRPWRNPVIVSVVGIIREHFTRRFSLERSSRPGVQSDRIQRAILESGYFEDKPVDDPELTSFSYMSIVHGEMLGQKTKDWCREMALQVALANIRRTNLGS